MFGFDKLITPQIINFLYIITLIALIACAVVVAISGNISTAIVLIIMAVFSRIFFECIMIAFKNNEYLRRIADSLERQEKNRG